MNVTRTNIFPALDWKRKTDLVLVLSSTNMIGPDNPCEILFINSRDRPLLFRTVGHIGKL
jgi:hypothetical protein